MKKEYQVLIDALYRIACSKGAYTQEEMINISVNAMSEFMSITGIKHLPVSKVLIQKNLSN